MAPGSKSKFSAPIFKPEVFRKQMHYIEESICDTAGTFRRPPQSFGAPYWFGALGIVRPFPASLRPWLPALNIHMRQNVYCRNLKCTFEHLLPCYCYAIKTNRRTIFATCLCRQRSGYEWTASSSLHDTITVILAPVQCGCHTGK